MGCRLPDILSAERQPSHFWVWVRSNQKTKARLKRCSVKARQREHFKQDASPVGDRMLGPPVETGAPGNLRKAWRDKTVWARQWKKKACKNENKGLSGWRKSEMIPRRCWFHAQFYQQSGLWAEDRQPVINTHFFYFGFPGWVRSAPKLLYLRYKFPILGLGTTYSMVYLVIQMGRGKSLTAHQIKFILSNSNKNTF